MRNSSTSRDLLRPGLNQLPIALARSFPAPHQYRDLFLATDQWREIALARPPSAAARTTCESL
jgi:hypothetical protein